MKTLKDYRVIAVWWIVNLWFKLTKGAVGKKATWWREESEPYKVGGIYSVETTCYRYTWNLSYFAEWGSRRGVRGTYSYWLDKEEVPFLGY